MVGEKCFTITGDTAVNLEWFGLRLDVPESALPVGRTTDLCFKAIVGGDFKLPQDFYLVGGIYQISCKEQLTKNVTLHLPHAAIIQTEEEATHFRFYTAECSNDPPYELKKLEGGSFIPFSNSASIDLHHFSCDMIAADIPPNQRYLSQVFYKSNSVKDWRMVFTITKDTHIFIEVSYSNFILVYIVSNIHLL